MKQSVSLITLGVSDYEKANAFYAALGWQPVLEIEETAFFQANGVVLVLWAREKLIDRLGRARISRPVRAPADDFAGVIGSVRVRSPTPNLPKEPANVTRPRPTVLHLARRFRHRRAPEPRRTIRPRRREAARVDVRHPLVGRNGRPARREPRHRRRLRAAARLWCRSRDHWCRQVRLPRMARGPGVEGVGGGQPPR